MAEEEVNNDLLSQKKSKKRGYYFKYLHGGSDEKMPKTSKYRWKKQLSSCQPYFTEETASGSDDTPSSSSSTSSTTTNANVDCQNTAGEYIVRDISSKQILEDEVVDNDDSDHEYQTDTSIDGIDHPSPPEPEADVVVTQEEKFVQHQEEEAEDLCQNLEDPTTLFSDGMHQKETDDSSSDESDSDDNSGPYLLDLEDDNYIDNEDNEDENENQSEEMENAELESEFGDDQPLYNGSRISVSVSIMLILTFVMRHHLTGVAVADLIALIEAHMLVPNLSRTVMKLIRRFFVKARGNVIFHYFCKNCLAYIGLQDKPFCNICETSSNGNPYFIVIPLLDNLQSLFKYTDFLKDLSYPITRQKKNAQNIEDVIDGEVYSKHFSKDGFLHGTTEDAKKNEIHISLQCNTDGVSLFKSSKVETWPIYYTINELSPSLRYRRKYRLFAGLWFSDKKPDFKTFLKPFVEELKEFSMQGKTVMTEKGEKLLKLFLFSGIFDAPAKSMFQNVVQFNGLYGCSYCLEPGKSCKTGVKGHVHVFPFNFDSKTGHTDTRCHKDTISHAQIAQQRVIDTGIVSTEFGIKGLAWSMKIPRFDVIDGLGLDYLHNTLLGVVKMLLKLWFNKKFKDMPWFIGSSVSKIDACIKNLRLPNLISRVPRNIENDFKNFKGSEFRTCLLFYSAVIFYDFLPEEYFQHYILLVEAIFLLLKDSISQADLKNAEKMLKHFCCKVPRLYGERYQTYNIHNLLHMVYSVKQHGPLWAQSAFWYEDYNGDYKHLFHGTQNVNIQIVTNTIVQHKIPQIVQALAPGSVGHVLYNKMTEKYHRNIQTLGECISPGIYCVGNQTPAVCCPVVDSLIRHLYPSKKMMFSFKRICFNGNVIQSQSYLRVVKRNTFTVKYEGRFGTCFGFIKYFLNLVDVDSKHHFLAVLEAPKVLSSSISKDTVAKLSHMVPVSFQNSKVDICEIRKIKEICCYLSSGKGRDFIIPFPNNIEKD